jgi:hypothetical protein
LIVSYVYNASFSLTDYIGGKGHTKAIPFYFLQTTPLAQIQEWIAVVAPLLDAITDAKIATASIARGRKRPSGVKVNAKSGSTVHKGALLSFKAADSRYQYSIFVPAICEDVMSKDTFNPAALDGAGQAFLDAVINQTQGVRTCNRSGADIISYVSGKRTHRK